MRIGVVVGADLRLVREWLATELGASPDVAVVGRAPSRADFLLLARRFTPDVLVFDRSMPDGLVAVQEILAEQPGLRVLAFGVQETEPEIAVCSEAGVHGFIPRDASRDALVESVRRVVRGEFVGSAEVARLLLRHVAQRTAPHTSQLLTGREIQIARLLDLGRSNKEIALALGIEIPTVKNHVHNILRKLQAHRRSEAASKWRACGRGGATTWVARRAG